MNRWGGNEPTNPIELLAVGSTMPRKQNCIDLYEPEIPGCSLKFKLIFLESQWIIMKYI